MEDPVVRLGELVAALSLATDLALGRPLEHELRTTVLSLRLGDSLGMDEEELRELYWVALLRYVGCTAHAHEVAVLFGDDIATRARANIWDMGSVADVLREIVAHAGEGRVAAHRVAAVISAVAAGRHMGDHLDAGCEVAQLLAERLGMGSAIVDALGFAFERWDGKGFPRRSKGEAIPKTMRVVQLANDVETFHRLGGVEEAVRMAKARRGAAFDPWVVDRFLAEAEVACASMDQGSAWDAVVEAEPEPRRVLRGRLLDESLEVVADFVDMKSPDLAGHSRAVSLLAAGAAEGLGLDDGTVARVRRAGLVHDLGRTGVSNAIWDKPGPLTDAEWERVRLHPYFTLRMLARAGGLAELADLAADHHERLDGSGYHRQLKGSQIAMPSRVLAAADSYEAMTEPRRWRPAFEPARAADELRAMAKDGRLDPEATNAVLSAAGHRVPKRGVWPAGLTNKEVEVLRLIARGHTNKQTAAQLFISERTVAHHLQHAYAKIGVRSRGAAALFAIEHAFLPGPPG